MPPRAALLPVLLCALLLAAPLAGADRPTLRPVESARDGGGADERGQAAPAAERAAAARDRRGDRDKRPPRRLETGVLTPAETADTPEPAGAARYNVVFAERAGDPKKATLDLAKEVGFKPTHVYRNLFQGFAARMTPAQARKLARDRRVASIGPARTLKLAAQTIPTGITRIGVRQNPMADIDGVDERVDADVMVIDELVALHPDLNVVSQADCVDGRLDGTEAGSGHGTHVAGSVGALDNGSGVVGVAPGARIWSVNVFRGGGALDSWIVCALDAAAKPAHGIEVVNMSLGGAGEDGRCGERDAFHNAVCRAVGAGVTVVVAAGNETADAARSVPAAYDEVITVSALDDRDGAPRNDRLAEFSNFGADVDIAAPGVGVYSTMPGGRYGTMSGTSMAAPHVAGAAALYLAEHPAATPAQVRQALLAAREPIALAGDPDGRAEGVLDVRALNDGSPDPAPDPEPDPDPGADAVPPSVAITSPAAGGRVRRTFTARVTAADDGSGVAAVDLYECSRGCRWIAADEQAPYEFRLTGSRGAYALQAVATDRAGNEATSREVPFAIRRK